MNTKTTPVKRKSVAYNEFSAQQVCALLNVSAPTLEEYIEKKGLPLLRGGGKGVPRVFDAHQVFLWITKKDEAVPEEDKTEKDKIKTEQEKFKLEILKGKAEAIKMANETLSGKLYPADVVDATWLALINNATKTISSLAPRLEHKLRQVEDPKKRVDIILDDLDSFRRTMADISYQFDMEFFEDLIENTNDEQETEQAVQQPAK